MGMLEDFLKTPNFEPEALIRYTEEADARVRMGEIPADRLLFYEQTAIACYMTGNTDLMEHCLKQLYGLVPGTARFNAINFVLGKVKDVAISEKVSWKRRIARLNGQERANELATFVEVHATDVEAYTELASVYESLGMDNQAIWCLHEVLLIIPTAYPICAKLGDFCYRKKDFSEALKWYLRSVELCDGYITGLIGVIGSAEEIQDVKTANWAKHELQATLEVPGKRSESEISKAREVVTKS